MLTVEVENHVREVLSERHGQPFSKRVLPLPSGGTHEFDAVSADGMIVASVKSSGGKTASGKHPGGKVNSAIAELYFLSLIAAPTRVLMLTTPEFHEIFMRTMTGKIADGIDVELVPLPSQLQDQVDEVQQLASLKVTPVLDAQEQMAANVTE